MNKMITILGPTASGKTNVAAFLSKKIGAEIISGDSRQIYRSMNIGTGKDLEEYTVDGVKIPYHLIDIVDAGYKYNVYRFQSDFLKAYQDVLSRNIPVVFCGGSGLYLESVLKGYRFLNVGENKELRKSLERESLESLTERLKSYKKLHNSTDVDTVKRAIRAIEIEEYYKEHEQEANSFPKIESVVFGLNPSREIRRERISRRLKSRLDNGMIDEVKSIIEKGISAEDLIYYGLEYKFVTLYIIGKISYDEMYNRLEIAIHQFAKRQMTWFRGMEKRGTKINWINNPGSVDESVDYILNRI